METVPLLNPGETAIPAGVVTHSYSGRRVTAVTASAQFGVGSTLVFQQKPGRKPSEHRVTVSSLEINKLPVETVQPGQWCGVELDRSIRKLPRKNDVVWLVMPAGTDPDDPPQPLVFQTDDDGAS